jgi:ApaG protein
MSEGSGVSVCVTQGIKVSVNTRFLPDQSEPDQQKYIFAYEVTITNQGHIPAKLLRRHWIIKDATHHVEEVRGEGVVGDTPMLGPGEAYTYVSWCPLRTEFGFMRGNYTMIRPNGQLFRAEIAPFALLPQYLLN